MLLNRGFFQHSIVSAVVICQKLHKFGVKKTLKQPMILDFFVFFNRNLLIFAKRLLMEQHTLQNVNNCLNTKIYSYLETSGGQSSNLYLNVVHFFNTSFY